MHGEGDCPRRKCPTKIGRDKCPRIIVHGWINVCEDKCAEGNLNARDICLHCVCLCICVHNVYTSLCEMLTRWELGFKSKRSTGMCTLILKETIEYYVHNSSTLLCTMLDATKAFDRVEYCRFFSFAD